jgi:hypothetical protein
MSSPADPVVRVSDFSKRYKNHMAVDGIDLEIRKATVLTVKYAKVPLRTQRHAAKRVHVHIRVCDGGPSR